MKDIRLLNFSEKILWGIFVIYMMALPFKNAIYQGSLVLLYGMTLWHVYKSGSIEWKPAKSLTIIFGLMFVSMSISNFFGSSYGYGIDAQVIFFYYFVPLFFVLYYLYTKEIVNFKKIFILIFVPIILVVGFGLKEFADMGYDLSYRLCGKTFNPNAMSVWLMIGIVLLNHLFLTTRSKIMLIVAFFGIAIFSFELLLTQSRAAWLATIVALVVYGVANRRAIFKMRVLGIVVFCLISLYYAWGYNEAFHARVVTILEGQTSNRVERLWPWAIGMIQQSPLFGYGMDSMRLLYAGEYPETKPHNIYLELLLFLGIVGFSVFMAFFAKVSFNLWNGIKEKKDESIILGSIFVGLLVDGCFDQSITMSLYFVPLFMIIGALSIPQKRGEMKS